MPEPELTDAELADVLDAEEVPAKADALRTFRPLRVERRAAKGLSGRVCRLIAWPYSFPPPTAARQAAACFSPGSPL